MTVIIVIIFIQAALHPWRPGTLVPLVPFADSPISTPLSIGQPMHKQLRFNSEAIHYIEQPNCLSARLDLGFILTLQFNCFYSRTSVNGKIAILMFNVHLRMHEIRWYVSVTEIEKNVSALQQNCFRNTRLLPELCENWNFVKVKIGRGRITGNGKKLNKKSRQKWDKEYVRPRRRNALLIGYTVLRTRKVRI